MAFWPPGLARSVLRCMGRIESRMRAHSLRMKSLALFASLVVPPTIAILGAAVTFHPGSAQIIFVCQEVFIW